MSFPALEKALGLDTSAVLAQIAGIVAVLPLGGTAQSNATIVAARLERMFAGRTLGEALDGPPVDAIGPDDDDRRRRLDALAASEPDPGARRGP